MSNVSRCSHLVDGGGQLREYREAEEYGRVSWRSDACSARYAACPFSIFSIVSLFKSHSDSRPSSSQ